MVVDRGDAPSAGDGVVYSTDTQEMVVDSRPDEKAMVRRMAPRPIPPT